MPPIAFTEFNLPESLISRKVHRALFYSPTDRVAEVEVAGIEKSNNDYIAMSCREELDPWIRQRAVQNGAELREASLITLDVDADGVSAVIRS